MEDYRHNHAAIEESYRLRVGVKAPRYASENYVPHALWRDNRLTRTAVCLYLSLLGHSDNKSRTPDRRSKRGYRSLNRLAADLGLTGPHRGKRIAGHLQLLIDCGYLFRLRQGRRRTQQPRASFYQINTREMTMAAAHDYAARAFPKGLTDPVCVLCPGVTKTRRTVVISSAWRRRLTASTMRPLTSPDDETIVDRQAPLNDESATPKGVLYSASELLSTSQRSIISASERSIISTSERREGARRRRRPGHDAGGRGRRDVARARCPRSRASTTMTGM